MSSLPSLDGSPEMENVQNSFSAGAVPVSPHTQPLWFWFVRRNTHDPNAINGNVGNSTANNSNATVNSNAKVEIKHRKIHWKPEGFNRMAENLRAENECSSISGLLAVWQVFYSPVPARLSPHRRLQARLYGVNLLDLMT
jgi:hypothetical protein